MPDHWQETTLGEIADLEIGRTPPRKASQYWTESLERPFCSIADMDGRVITPTREGVTELAEDDNKARRISAGSLLMSFKLTIGRMAFAGCDLFPNEAIVAITPNEASASREFLYLDLGSRDLTEGSGQAVKGKTLNSKSLRAINIHLPSLEEQRRIVDLVGSIDTYIDTLETQIETTRTARSALLSELLSNPGDHVQRPLGEVSSSRLGKMLDKKRQDEGDQCAYLRNANVRWREINTEDLAFMGFTPSEKIEFSLTKGDVLVCEGGEPGRAAVVEEDLDNVFFQKALHRVRCNEELLPQFLVLSLEHQSRVGVLRDLITSTSIAHLTGVKLRQVEIALVSIADQKRIVDLVGSFDEQISSLESQIELVRALRSGVLSELLSGDRLLDDSYDMAVGL